MSQKVITVNIDTFVSNDEKLGYKEIELELVNKYLADGYTVTDKFPTVNNSTSTHCINLTFILTKGIKI
jgi:hypothetical protein